MNVAAAVAGQNPGSTRPDDVAMPEPVATGALAMSRRLFATSFKALKTDGAAGRTAAVDGGVAR